MKYRRLVVLLVMGLVFAWVVEAVMIMHNSQCRIDNSKFKIK